MDTSFFFGGSVMAAVVAGAIALFAPCCISVMLPAYFASSFHNRRLLVAMTFLFAAGVATVVLPIALGAATIRQLLLAGHRPVYLAGGALLLGLAAYTLAGGALRLPMPGRRAATPAGPGGVYALGVFAGVASACCAPVLAGVVALSGVASSFLLALGLGGAYVLGMVAPLFAIALLWDRYDWASSRLFRPRWFTFRVGGLRRRVSGTALASGVLLAVMGAVTVWIGLTGQAMPTPTGWQARMAAWLQHLGSQVTRALSWLPAPAAWVLLAVAVGLLARLAARQVGWTTTRDHEATPGPSDAEEHAIERQDA